MVKHKLLKSSHFDALIEEHKSFINFVRQEHKEEFSQYKLRESPRLDKFLQTVMDNNSEFAKLWKLVKCLLILSHGQAAVERGFSINKDTLKTNLSEKNLTALWIVTDSVRNKLGSDHMYDVHKIKVTKQMLVHCKSARARYHQFLDDEKAKARKLETGKRKARLLEELSDKKSNRLNLGNSSKRLLTEADEMLITAEKEKNLILLSKANELRKKSKQAVSDAENETKAIQALEDKLRNIK